MSSHHETRLNSLTGLRFVAAMVVFVSHLLEIFPLLGTTEQVKPLVQPMGLGGVGFFYVLSGFILTYVYSRRKTPLSIRDFYVRRIARVWPLHIVTMLIVLFGVITVSNQISREDGLAKLAANIFLMQSWWPDYAWVFSINAPSWSLSNEAFFYAVFPWLLAGGAVAFKKKFIAFICIGISTLAALSAMPEGTINTRTLSSLMHANPLFRSFDFMIGMTCGFFFVEYQERAGNADCADKRFHQFRSAAFQLTALSSCVAYYLAVYFWLEYQNQQAAETHSVCVNWLRFSGAAPLYAITIFTFARSTSWISRIFASPAMIYLGEASFAFYLIHQPIQRLLGRQEFADSPFAIWWIAAAALAFSLAAAMLLHHLIELPSRTGLIQLFSRSDSNDSWVRRCGTWFAEYGKATWRLGCHPRIVVVTVLAIAGFVLMENGRFDYRDTSLINQVVNQTSPEFKNIQFDQDAVLRGLLIDRQPEGGLRVKMVWDLKKNRRPVRFLHICDSSGKILRHANGNRSMFSQASGNEVVLDRVTISREQLDSAGMLAIGFYGPERKSAAIMNRRPGQPTHRLPILRLDRHSAVESRLTK